MATAEAAALADQDPPLDQLMRLLKERKEVEKGESVVYWMRMEDVRSTFPSSPADDANLNSRR